MGHTEIVHAVLENVGWRHSDQNMLSNLETIYTRNPRLNDNTGGHWRINERQFVSISVESFTLYYRQISKNFKLDWNEVKYTELSTDNNLSAISCMLLIQNELEKGLSLGWGDYQCTFISNLFDISEDDCVDVIAGNDEFSSLNFIQSSQKIQFEIQMDLYDGALGIDMIFQSENEQTLIFGLKLAEDCKDVSDIGEYDFFGKTNTSAIATFHYSYPFSEDGDLSCEKEYKSLTSEKKQVFNFLILSCTTDLEKPSRMVQKCAIPLVRTIVTTRFRTP